jgi:hypothetical protein
MVVMPDLMRTACRRGPCGNLSAVCRLAGVDVRRIEDSRAHDLMLRTVESFTRCKSLASIWLVSNWVWGFEVG